MKTNRTGLRTATIAVAIAAAAIFIGGQLSFVGSAWAASSSGVQDDYLIVPDQRIGPVALGMSDKDLFKIFIPDVTSDGGTWLVYGHDGMRIWVDKTTHTVIAIELYEGNSYHTADGLKLGSSLEDIEAAMGPPEALQGNQFFGNLAVDVHYHAGAMAFSFVGDNASMADAPERSVQSIAIQAPGIKLY